MEQQAISEGIRVHSSPVTTEDTLGYNTLARLSDDGSYMLSLLVDGVHCAACIQKIESTLARERDIKNVRLNFSTRRLSVTWEGKPCRADDYVRTVENMGYTVHPFDAEQDKTGTRAEERFLLLCLGVAGFAMGNIMLLSVGVWTTNAETMGIATRDFMHWLSAVVGLPAILFSGRPFFRSAIKALSAGHTNMDVPISLALILAGGMSLFETVSHGEHVYFDSAVMLMFFLLIGRYLDFRARKNARSVATELISGLSGFATVLDGGRAQRMAVRDLREGMAVRVAVGEKFPVDGEVAEGRSEVDTSLVTGESLPRDLKQGAEVFAGTVNLSAPVTITVAKASEDSLLADIIKLMEKAEQAQSAYVRLADRAARLYTPVVHSLAFIAFTGWWLFGGLVWQDSLMIAITVLIITCPCALGLAVPVVQVLATGRLMKNGILVKSGDALERMAVIDTVFFDKTGTLTAGQLELDGIYAKKDLQLAASLAAHSVHPLSKAIVISYKGPLLEVTDVCEYPGQGLEGRYQGKRVQLGSRTWCGDTKMPPTEKTELWFAAEGKKPGPFYFSDHLRTDAEDTVSLLKQEGLAVAMLSGDQNTVAEKIAGKCSLDEYYTQQTPSDKYRILEDRKAHGHKVLMVGDGLNDAPVLAGADISMAPGTAIDMAQNAADIVFMSDNLFPVYEAYITAKKSQNLVKQNFTLAVLYNIIAVPLALAGLVTPLVAAIAMSGSSLMVVANSFRLKGKGV